jgi:hypothetical protein
MKRWTYRFSDSLLSTYFMVWALIIPVTSVIVSPAIPGSVPAYLLAFASFPLALLIAPQKSGGLVLAVGAILIPLFLLTITAQFNLQFFWRTELGNLFLVNLDDDSLILRSSLFTQLLYLLPGVFTFAFLRVYYDEAWDKFILAGAVLLAVYGFFEVTYYLVTGQNGDFLSNRVFDNGAGVSSGSLFQTMSVGGFHIMRLKSLTGEPSMYAFTILPFWIHAVHQRKMVTSAVLLVSLLLSTSTSALLGIGLYLLCRIYFLRTSQRFLRGYADRLLTLFFILSLVALVIAFPFVSALLQETSAKFSGENTSGIERLRYIQSGLGFFRISPLTIQLFGLGFGYTRSADFFSTLLVNTGLIGTLLFSVLFIYPILRLENTYRSIGLKSILIVIFIIMMISVPEFAYLSTWLFLGISYRALRTQ